jgi:hypothetical protein
MTPTEPSTPPSEEIIAPIQVRRRPDAEPTAGRSKPRRVRTWVALGVMAGLATGGLWWIDHLSRNPAAIAPEAPRAETPPPLALPPKAPAVPTELPSDPAPLPPEAAAPIETPTDPPLSTAVAQRLAAAERLAAAGELSAARSEFEEAVRLDPQSRPARDGLERIQTRILAAEFRRRMAEGFSALNAGKPAEAQALFLEAQTLRPAAPEVVEALLQAESRLRAARIEAARAKALAAEAHEEWASAFAAYEEALEVDPGLQFARQGKERAAARLRLEQGIGRFLAQPELLDADSGLAHAEGLLDEIRAAPPDGPRLRAAGQRLAELVAIARTPVRVTIESDHLTDVSVYRVGRLGRFGMHELSLRPGTYTVVGSRDGFRDERIELVVRPGLEPVRVAVFCKIKV